MITDTVSQPVLLLLATGGYVRTHTTVDDWLTPTSSALKSNPAKFL